MNNIKVMREVTKLLKQSFSRTIKACEHLINVSNFIPAQNDFLQNFDELHGIVEEAESTIIAIQSFSSDASHLSNEFLRLNRMKKIIRDMDTSRVFKEHLESLNFEFISICDAMTDSHISQEEIETLTGIVQSHLYKNGVRSIMNRFRKENP